MFSKIAFSVKNGPFRHIFHIDSAKYRAFFRQSEMLASKQHYLGKKHGNFSYVIYAKCFSFHGLRKCVASKEHMTFCLIQRKAKGRCILLIQIFNFLLRLLLNLVKVHIMLCTFKSRTIKSLILTHNMFTRFFSFSFDMVSRTV